MKGFWTDDVLTSLKDFWNRGWSASQIAAQLRTSRNAVLGKIHRLGLSGRVMPVSDEERRRREERRRQKHAERERSRRARLGIDAPRPPRVARAELPAPPYLGYALDIPFAELRPLSIAGANQCRYIAAEPPGPQFLACGNDTPAGQSYCAHCSTIVFRSDPRAAVAMNRPARAMVAA